MRKKNYSGSWFTDMIRDNFMMLVALWYSKPEPEPLENQGGGDIDYLFGDSTGNNPYYEDYYGEYEDAYDGVSNLSDYYHNDFDDCCPDYLDDLNIDSDCSDLV